MHSKCLVFFPFKFWVVWGGRGEGEEFFHFFFVPNMFPSSSQRVLNMFLRFSMCSPRVFPIAPCLNPICLPKVLPFPKGEALHLSIESSILESLHSFNFFWCGANKIGSLQKKKKVGLVRHPQLINMRQKKYPRLAYVTQHPPVHHPKNPVLGFHGWDETVLQGSVYLVSSFFSWAFFFSSFFFFPRSHFFPVPFFYVSVFFWSPHP